MREKAERLRQAFQSGNDQRMLDILWDDGLLGDLVRALNTGSDRVLTYSAPQIADLATRMDGVAKQERA